MSEFRDRLSAQSYNTLENMISLANWYTRDQEFDRTRTYDPAYVDETTRITGNIVASLDRLFLQIGSTKDDSVEGKILSLTQEEREAAEKLIDSLEKYYIPLLEAASENLKTIPTISEEKPIKELMARIEKITSEGKRTLTRTPILLTALEKNTPGEFDKMN